LTKLVAKYKEGIFLLCQEGEAELKAEKAHVGVGQLSSPCGKKNRHCIVLEKSSFLTHRLDL
jgi:hypothetical protein